MDQLKKNIYIPLLRGKYVYLINLFTATIRHLWKKEKKTNYLWLFDKNKLFITYLERM